MAKRNPAEMVREIIMTDAYANDGKVVKINRSGKREVYENIIDIKSIFAGGDIEIKNDEDKKIIRYIQSDRINNISCEK